MLINCYMIEDKSGMPDSFIIDDKKQTGAEFIFGTLEGPEFKQYKVALEFD